MVDENGHGSKQRFIMVHHGGQSFAKLIIVVSSGFSDTMIHPPVQGLDPVQIPCGCRVAWVPGVNPQVIGAFPSRKSLGVADC